MTFSLTIATVIALLVQGSAQKARVPNLRAYVKEVKVSSTEDGCSNPAEVTGSIQMTGCDKVYYFDTGGSNTQCVHNGGSTRTNGTYNNISNAGACANKCMEDESKVGRLVGMNYVCGTKTCKCLFGGGSVEDTMTKSGSECYAVTGAISGTSQLPNGQKRSRYCAEQSIVELKN